MASSLGACRAVSALIKLGADPNATSPDDGATALHAACGARPEQLDAVIKALIASGADKDRRDALGRLPVDLLLQV